MRAVKEASRPTTASEVRSFLRLVGCSSRFILDFVTIAETLRMLGMELGRKYRITLFRPTLREQGSLRMPAGRAWCRFCSGGEWAEPCCVLDKRQETRQFFIWSLIESMLAGVSVMKKEEVNMKKKL